MSRRACIRRDQWISGLTGAITLTGAISDAGRLATAKASRLGPAVVSQGYGQSYSSKDPAWTTAGASMENLELVSDVSGVTDYAYQGDRATTLTNTLGTTVTATTLGYDFAGRTWSLASGGVEVEGFVQDVLDRLEQVRHSGEALRRPGGSRAVG